MPFGWVCGLGAHTNDSDLVVIAVVAEPAAVVQAMFVGDERVVESGADHATQVALGVTG